MDNQSQLPIQFFNFKHSDKNSDIFSFHPSYVSDLDHNNHNNSYVSHLDHNNHNNTKNKNYSNGQQSIKQFISDIQDKSITLQQAQQYFDLLFSPKVVTQCLIRRNQYLEMKCFDQSQSEQDNMYKKRKERVNNLQEKQKKNWEILLGIKEKDYGHYKEIVKFMILLGQVKAKLNGIRHDYYSQKTFLTLKKASSQQIQKLTKIFKQILITVLRSTSQLYYLQQHHLTATYLQFLIIPRFIISKQKLLKFLTEQKLQQNFTFLIFHGCLGHYNNQANKKLPQQQQMKFIRQLLIQKDGKQKFKNICRINHGSKFIKKYGKIYYQLYQKSLECLKNIDQMCKKNCKFQEIMGEMAKDVQINKKNNEQEVNPRYNLQEQEFNPNLSINFPLSLNKQPHYPNPYLMLSALLPPLNSQCTQIKSISSFLPSQLNPFELQQKKLTNTTIHFKTNYLTIPTSTICKQNQICIEDLGNKCTVKRFYSLFNKMTQQKQQINNNQNNTNSILSSISIRGRKPMPVNLQSFNNITQLTQQTANNQPAININPPPSTNIILTQPQYKTQQFQNENRMKKSNFKMRRFYTMQSQRQKNIIIVHPPSNHNNHNHNHNCYNNKNKQDQEI